MSSELILLILLLCACIIFIIAVLLYDKEMTRLEHENIRLKSDSEYWKKRNFKKDDVINEIYQLIKNHYGE